MIFCEDLYSTYLVWFASCFDKFSIPTVKLRPAFLADKVETLVAVRNADDLVVTIAHKNEGDCCTADFDVFWKESGFRTLKQNIHFNSRHLFLSR